MFLLTDGRNREEHPRAERPGEYEVIRKFFPYPTNRDGEFLTTLLAHNGDTVNCWIPMDHFAEVDIGDVIYLPSKHQSWIGRWTADYQVRHAHFPLEHVIEELRFVSLPVRIGQEAYYVCHFNMRYIVIPYSVAKRYFSRDGFTGGVDYYRVLGIPRHALQEEIRLAYRNRARHYHPDRAPTGQEREYANRMCLLNEAYEVLRDEQKRHDYNHQGQIVEALKRWPGGGPGTLTALIEKRREWWIVREILGFRRKSRVRGFDIPVHKIVFGPGRVHVPSSLPEHSDLEAWIEINEPSFAMCPEMNDVKGEIDGLAILTITDYQRAEWDDSKGAPAYHWVTKEVVLEWPEQAIEKLSEMVGHYMAVVP